MQRKTLIALSLTGVVIAVAAITACSSASGGHIAINSQPTTIDIGPRLGGPDSHWHAALGVWDCNHWLGDASGAGIWYWPTATPQGSPARAHEPSVYAGLHSHDDGIIHMEPATADDAGNNATVGRYFEEGGWQLSSDGFSFLGTTRHNGDACGATKATLQWWVNGKAHTGHPAAYKLFNNDVVVIAFEQAGSRYPGTPPSAGRLPDSAARTPATDATSTGACVAAKGPFPPGAPNVPVPVGPAPTKLVIKDLVVGKGPVVPRNAKVTMKYILVTCSTGQVVDSSYSRGDTFDADLSGGLIQGWIDGIPGMHVGGRRLLGVPPALGYGPSGAGPIGPNETLWFVVDAVKLG